MLLQPPEVNELYTWNYYFRYYYTKAAL